MELLLNKVKELILNDIENKKNVTIDLCFYLSQNIEEVDDSQITIEDIFKKFIKTRDELVKFGI